MDTMTLQRFAELADAWGADVSRWPAQAQADALAVLASDDGVRARAVLAQAEQLDRALLQPVPAPGAALRARILRSAPHGRADARAPGVAAPAHAGQPVRRGRASRVRARSTWAPVWRELGGTRIAGPALAAALVLGVALAEIAPPDAAIDTLTGATVTMEGDELLSAALLGPDYEEYAL